MKSARFVEDGRKDAVHASNPKSEGIFWAPLEATRKLLSGEEAGLILAA